MPLTNDSWHEQRLLIDGELVGAEGGATYDNINPANEEIIGKSADASKGDLQRAIDAGRRAFDQTEWSRDVGLRVAVSGSCTRRSLTTTTTSPTSPSPKSVLRACSSVVPSWASPSSFSPSTQTSLEGYEWHQQLGVAPTMAGLSNRWIEREAVGLVAAITPWNYPNQINIAKLAPALAAGCTVVLKPAPDTPWTALALGRLAAEHTDLPPGVLNVITSADKTIGEAIDHQP